jgi:hypothetical protein
MAITVKTFMVSNDRLTIDVDLEVGAGQLFTEVLLWTEATYKNPDTAIDLSSKLAGVDNTEVFTITAADAGVATFEGIYIAEITSNDPLASIVATAPLSKYYAVMASLLAGVDLSCLNCNPNFQNALLLDLYVEAMKQALVLGRFQDAISYLQRINLYTSISCDSCDNIDPVVSSAGNIVSVGVIDCILTA